MSCQDILAMRKLITQKYDEYEPHLNPFSRMLFCDNWQWPSSYLSQSCQPRIKNQSSKTSLKTDITSWFLSLGSKQKCAFTTIKNPVFLFAFLQTYHKCNPNMLYHIYLGREIPDYIQKNADWSTFGKIVQYLRIAWLDEPVLYFQIEEDQIQAVFLLFMNWMDQISNTKIFQYAHKVKNKNEPEENLLWFTEQSFQQLQGWLINQYEKTITKNYFDRNNFEADIYDKIIRLKQGINKKAQHSAGTGKKDLEKLLSMHIEQTKQASKEDYVSYQMKVKVYEDFYYEQAALLMDYENNGICKEDQNKKKKKKNKRKKNKQKNKEKISSGENLIDYDAQSKEQVAQERLIIKFPEDNGEQVVVKHEENMQQVSGLLPNNDKPIFLQQQLKIEKVQRNQENMNSLDKVSVEQLQSSQSVSSSSWSDLVTKNKYKVNKNSTGKSHPEFYQTKQQLLEIDQIRSLSQQNETIQTVSRLRISIGAKKQQQISTWKKDSQQFDNKNWTSSFVSEKNSDNSELVARQYQIIKNSSELAQSSSGQDKQFKDQNFKLEENEDSVTKVGNQQFRQSPQNDKNGKKRRKKNKTLTLQKELSKKISSSLINKQLNQFVDTLSLQTNNLYDYKRVSFQRVRYFIQSLFPTTQSMLFGSNAVGLSLPTSDIDIMLYNLPCSTKQEAGQVLAHLAIQINTMAWIVSCSAYLTAKVPLVKLQINPSILYVATKRKCDYMMWPMNIQHLQLMPKKQGKNQIHTTQGRFTEKVREHQQIKCNDGYEEESEKPNYIHNNKIIKVDLTVNLNDEGNLGAQSTELMKKWMGYYPQIQRAVIGLKYILAQRGYSSNFKGGIGSYCLFIMIAAFVKEFPYLSQLDDGEFFMAILKFYGQQFENHLKSIKLLSPDPEDQTEQIPPLEGIRKSCFVTLQETYQIILKDRSLNNYGNSANNLSDCSPQELLHHSRDNPLRIFDPINNRIMSGSCQMYPQIKAQFRRIYKDLKQLQSQTHQEVEMHLNSTQIQKMFENKKCFDKWFNKYEARSGFSIKKILNNDS